MDGEHLDCRTRLLRVLSGQSVDRPPIICTGGSMSAVSSEVVALSGFTLPDAHADPREMAGLALAAAHITGFESLGLPLCATVEVEAFGASVDLGDAQIEARVLHEPFESVVGLRLPSVDVLLARGRVGLVVEAVRELADEPRDLPIFANVIGPASIAAGIIGPTPLMRELRTRPVETEALLGHVTDFLVAWTRQLIEAGADVIAIFEDTATPALVGPATFAASIVPHLRRLIDAVHAVGGKAVLHMCGPLGKAAPMLRQLNIDGYLPDAALSPAEVREALPGCAVIGNISTLLLHQGDAPDIASLADRLIGPDGVDALSPTCGLSSLTPLANIAALTGAARRHGRIIEEVA